MQGGVDRTNDMLKGAGIGAAVGGLIGLIARLVPLWIPGLNWVIEEGALASTLVGAVIGAVIGALLRRLRTANASRDHESALTAPAVTDTSRRSVQDEQIVPLVEEELAIGKREVTKGGIRVRTRVETVPAEQTVQLRQEHATVERVPVDRPVPAGEDLFKERTFEVVELAEEAVVQKRTRVKEEVRIAKQITERTETLRETVRRTDIDVEQTTGRQERRVNKGPYAGPDRRLAAVR